MRHPHHRHRRRGRDRGEHADRGAEVDRPVLQVDGDALEALVRHHLGGVGVGDREPAVEHGAAAGENLAQGVGSHGASLLFVMFI